MVHARRSTAPPVVQRRRPLDEGIDESADVGEKVALRIDDGYVWALRRRHPPLS